MTVLFLQIALVVMCLVGVKILTENPASLWANILVGFLLAISVVCFLSLIVYAKRSRFGKVEPPPDEDRLAGDRAGGDAGTPSPPPSDQSKKSQPVPAAPTADTKESAPPAIPAAPGSGNQGGTKPPCPPQPPPPLPDPPPPPSKVTPTLSTPSVRA